MRAKSNTIFSRSSAVLFFWAALGACQTSGVPHSKEKATPLEAQEKPLAPERPRPVSSIPAATQGTAPAAETALIAYGWTPHPDDKPIGKGLVATRLSEEQSGEEVLTHAPVSWCFVDHRAQVVWFAEEPAGKSARLSVYDLVTKRVETVVNAMPSLRFSFPDHLEIKYPDQSLNPLDPYHYRVGIQLELEIHGWSPRSAVMEIMSGIATKILALPTQSIRRKVW